MGRCRWYTRAHAIGEVHGSALARALAGNALAQAASGEDGKASVVSEKSLWDELGGHRRLIRVC